MKKIIALLVLFLSVQLSIAQNEYEEDDPKTEEEEFVGFDKAKKERKDWAKRFRIGGIFGLGFGNRALALEVSPMIGYHIVENRLEIATGIIYRYFREFNYRSDQTIGTNNYLRIYIWDGLFAQARGFYVKNYVKLDSGLKGSFRGGNVFLGGGYSVNLGRTSTINMGLEVSMIKNDLYPERIFLPFFSFQFGF